MEKREGEAAPCCSHNYSIVTPDARERATAAVVVVATQCTAAAAAAGRRCDYAGTPLPPARPLYTCDNLEINKVVPRACP